MGVGHHSRRAWPQDQRDRLTALYREGKSDKEIARILDRPIRGVKGQRFKMGLVTKYVEPEIPADFAEWVQGKSLGDIRRRLVVGSKIAQRLRDQYGVAVLNIGPRHLPPPDDFAEVAPRMTVTRCGEHYKRSFATIKRWYEQAGIAPAVYVQPPRARNGKSVNWGARQPISFGATGDGSIAHAAANHLRRIGFTNVYRATVLDRAARVHLPAEGRHHYSVSGRGFMHESEMIAMAESRGFRDGAHSREFAA